MGRGSTGLPAVKKHYRHARYMVASQSDPPCFSAFCVNTAAQEKQNCHSVRFKVTFLLVITPLDYFGYNEEVAISMKKFMYFSSWPFGLMALGWGMGTVINLIEGNFDKIPEGIGYTVLFGFIFTILFQASEGG